MSQDPIFLIPAPSTLIHHEGSTPLPAGLRRPSFDLPDTVVQLAKELCTADEGPELVLRISEEIGNSQAYSLEIKASGVFIEGASERGIWYGLQTLRQLVGQEGRLPCIEIHDTPDFQDRGFMLDISRNKVPTQASLLELVELLSLLKINQLQLYTEHTFAYDGHELVWGDASPMTAAEIRALDAWCRDHFIELVPNQNSFGHMERWLRYPEYFHLAESPHGWNAGDYLVKDSGTVLKPNQASLDFMGQLYDQLLPHFSSRQINIGCDETWELGLGWSRPIVEKSGKQAVYLGFLSGLADEARKRGRTVQFWADILLKDPDSIQDLPDDALPVLWGYDADHPFEKECALLARSGRPFYVAPGTSTWKTLTGNLDNALQNLRNAAQHGTANGARGLLITNWGDNGHHQTWPLTLPSLVYGAALAWSMETNRGMDLESALSRLIFKKDSSPAAHCLLKMGQLDQLSEISPETSLTNQLFTVFFSDNTNLSRHLRDWDQTRLRDLIVIVEELALKLPKGLDASPATSLLYEEIRLSLDMAVWACRRGIAWFQLIENENSQAYADLRPSLQEIIGRFENIWIHRNRIGGLHESSRLMRSILNQMDRPRNPIDYRHPASSRSENS